MTNEEYKKLSIDEFTKVAERYPDRHYTGLDLTPAMINLFSDDMNTLSKDKNAAFEFCEAEYFLAYKDGKLAGRVAIT